MGAKKPKQQTQQRVEIPDFIKGPAQNFFGQINNALNQDSVTAPFNANQTAAQNQLLGQTGALQQLGGNALQGLNYFSNQNILSPETNPYLQSVIDNNSRDITRNFTESILPTLRRNAAGAGQGGAGSTRAGIAEGLAAGRTSEAVGNSSANILASNFQNSQQLFQQGVRDANALGTSSAALGGSAQAVVGDAQQNQEQQQLLDIFTKLGLIQGPFGASAPFLGANQTSTSSPGSSSGVDKAIGIGSILAGGK